MCGANQLNKGSVHIYMNRERTSVESKRAKKEPVHLDEQRNNNV